jgi:thioredoxin-dependent peroxiredoxin
MPNFHITSIILPLPGCLGFPWPEPQEDTNMTERTGIITIHGNPLTLVGEEIKAGMPAPDTELVDNDLNPVKLSSFRGKVVILTSVPSLDTPVCDIETRRFNDEAAMLGPEVTIVTISMDLPFAQKRWCGAAGVEKVKTLSDHWQAAFGQAYGVLIKELRLLARAVFIVDGAGTVQYVQLVKEVASEPDYEQVMQALQKVLAK